MPWLRIVSLACFLALLVGPSARADDEKSQVDGADGADSADSADGADSAEHRFLRAWFDIEDPEKRAAAEKSLLEILDTDGLDQKLLVRANLGVARLEKLRGKPTDARLRLEKLIEVTKRGGSLRRMVVGQLGRPKWFHAIRVIQPGFATYLDLDTGGLTRGPDRHPRGGPEMNGSTILVKNQLDPEFGAAAPPMSVKPWHRLRTDEGNLSWVQVLATSPQIVVRFITRVGGWGATLAAPRSPFCIGYNSKIEVWWHTNPLYAKYRVERRIGFDGAWEDAGYFVKPPFIDRRVEPSARYGYRIFGVTEHEIEGLPVQLQGTVRSRGVTSGRVEIKPQRGFDFLLGDTVPTNRGDIRVFQIWQQGAMIQNYAGANLFPSNTLNGAAEPRSPWDATATGNWQLKTGDVFFAPLRGGGVVRCQITIRTVAKNRNRYAADLEYLVYGDSDIFPEPPTITAEQTDDGVRVTATVAEPFRLAQAEVRELLSGKGPWRVELDENGVGYDRRKGVGDIREYTAVAMDAHGRRTLPGRTSLVQMADEPVHGTFQIRHQQGYSVEQKKIVSLAQMSSSDIFFQAAQSGKLKRIFFHSPHGMMNLSNSLDWKSLNVTEGQIFDRLVSVDPKKFATSAVSTWSDSGKKGESIFILRTRHGGWVKLWISSRAGTGDWRRRKVTVKYVYNPRTPTFDKSPGVLTERNGLTLSDLGQIEESGRIVAEWSAGWKKLRRDGAFVRQTGDMALAGGAVADADDVQEVLLEQLAYKDETTARYSFSLGVRDPPETAVPENAWDVRWKGYLLQTRLSNNDHSSLTDLGRMHWLRIQRQAQLAPRNNRSAKVRYGHVYLHRKVIGKSQGAVTLLRIIGMEPQRRLQMEWVRLSEGKLTVSPGLLLDAVTRDRLQTLLAAVPKDDAETAKVLGSEKAWATFGKLQTREIGPIGKKDVKLSELIPELSLVSGVQFVLEGDAAAAKVSVLSSKLPLLSLVFNITDASNLNWEIDAQGRVRLRPYQITTAEKREIAAAEQLRMAAIEREKKRKAEEKRREQLAELKDVREALKRAIEELEGK